MTAPHIYSELIVLKNYIAILPHPALCRYVEAYVGRVFLDTMNGGDLVKESEVLADTLKEVSMQMTGDKALESIDKADFHRLLHEMRASVPEDNWDIFYQRASRRIGAGKAAVMKWFRRESTPKASLYPPFVLGIGTVATEMCFKAP